MKVIIKYTAISTFLIVLIIFSGQAPWFFWDFLWLRTFLNILFLVAIIFTTNINRIKMNDFVMVVILILLYSYFILKDLTNLGYISNIFLIIGLFYLKNDQIRNSFFLLRKIVICLLIPSLIYWILYLLKINLPYSELAATWKDPSLFTSQYHNYYLFIVKLYTPLRFSFIFDEPGTLGTFIAFLLAADKFKVSKGNIFLFITGLFTLSLAFIILVTIGVLIFKFKITVNRVLYALVFVIILITLINTVPILKEEVLPRLEINNGKLAGYNRETKKFDKFYSEFIKTKDVYFGKEPGYYGKIYKDFNIASYKMIIVNYGLIGVFLLIVIYLIILFRHFSYYTLCFFVIFALSFFQRPYALQSWQLALFFIVIFNYKLELIFKKSNSINGKIVTVEYK